MKDKRNELLNSKYICTYNILSYPLITMNMILGKILIEKS